MGLTSTNPLTITEQSEKNSDDNVAKIMPKYGQLNLDFIFVSQRLEVSIFRKPSTN